MKTFLQITAMGAAMMMMALAVLNFPTAPREARAVQGFATSPIEVAPLLPEGLRDPLGTGRFKWN